MPPGTPPTVVIILLSVLISTFAHVALKLGARSLAGADGVASALYAATASGWLWGGLVCHGLALGLWVWALARAPLSYVYPFIAVGFVLTNVFASSMLGESVPVLRWAGAIVICLGVAMVARSG